MLTIVAIVTVALVAAGEEAGVSWRSGIMQPAIMIPNATTLTLGSLPGWNPTAWVCLEDADSGDCRGDGRQLPGSGCEFVTTTCECIDWRMREWSGDGVEVKSSQGRCALIQIKDGVLRAHLRTVWKLSRVGISPSYTAMELAYKTMEDPVTLTKACRRAAEEPYVTYRQWGCESVVVFGVDVVYIKA